MQGVLGHWASPLTFAGFPSKKRCKLFFLLGVAAFRGYQQS